MTKKVRAKFAELEKRMATASNRAYTDENQLTQLRKEVECSKHKYLFKEKIVTEPYNFGVFMILPPPSTIYRYKCTKCGGMVDRKLDELGDRDRQAMKRLNMLNN